MTFYERIENLRKSHNLSQGKLEKELGFSNGSVSKWKNSMPTPERLQKIADYFGVSIDFLLTGKNETNKLYGVEYVREECNRQNIPVSTLEKDCGFANGYLNPKKVTRIPYERALLIADYLKVDINNVLGSFEQNEVILTNRDERDITNDLRKMMANIRNDKDGPLYYNGEEIDEASRILLENALEHAMRETKKINKQRFGRRKDPK